MKYLYFIQNSTYFSKDAIISLVLIGLIGFVVKYLIYKYNIILK